MRKILKFYDKAEEYFLVGSLVLTVAIVFLQVVMRYAFNASLSWSEELTRYIFIWQIWLGASIGFRDRKHIKVEITKMFFGPKIIRVLDILADLIWMATNIYFVYGGTVLVGNLMRIQSLSTAMLLPLWIVYAALPFSSAVLVVRQLLALGHDIKNLRVAKEA
jgi:C4-dicarboxylate transporter, DctQ subunit